ncbi:MogA/MoaB family molybdenum cofactor biosynthesis protein [Athalassotoga saccharophila]|uniref:MogA/MoaB family molybdenum cofactor biosynthesis protein n=1 Tax=Athalassotoga saccharophila TaxID=1441386 RepID=UPI0013799D77|nr:MogA/MoaB family molybdenum cofactor biosynthesis protein [Athalassotoga saccharophila]BBJ28736.1 molybdopterin adenylyltransferase [Athalassotoga saccharophila]
MEIPFLKIGVLTVSDRCYNGQMKDENFPAIKDMVSKIGEVVVHETVPDEKSLISSKIVEFCDNLNVDLVLTAGGTGFSPRDVTPEATLAVIEKEVPGIPEIMRVSTFFSKTKKSILSRGVAGIRGKSLIINLPGNPNGVKEDLEVVMDVLPLGISILKGMKEGI